MHDSPSPMTTLSLALAGLLFTAPPSPVIPEAPLIPEAPETRAVQATRSGPLTPGQMEADIFQISDKYLALHAGLNRYTSPEQIDEAIGEALLQVSEERTPLEFYRILSRLCSAVRCGHTRVMASRRIVAEAAESRGLLPMQVYLDGARLFVHHSFDEQLPAGSEILSIDGRSIAEIRKQVFALTSGDGFIETGKERALESRFATYYALFVQSTSNTGPFALQLRGAPEALHVTGISSADLARARISEEREEVIALEVRKDSDVALLRVSTFGDPGGGERFPELLGVAFEEVRAAEVGNLILDLRGNGGGDDEYGALLVSYFAQSNFGYFDHICVTEGYEGQGGIISEGGKRLVSMHPGTQSQEPSAPSFRGKAYVLIDGGTFSTAADAATVMHHLKLATFVGEETGGGYDGNTSGITERDTLESSGVGFTCPHWMYTTANLGHAYFGRGAPADHSPEVTIDDVLAGRDPELEFILEQIAAD